MDFATAQTGEAAKPTTSVDRPIDLVHLARMTLGEPNLEHEVLGLFDRQAAMLRATGAFDRPGPPPPTV